MVAMFQMLPRQTHYLTIEDAVNALLISCQPSRSPVTLVDNSWKNSKLLLQALDLSLWGLSAPGVDLCSGSARSAGQLISQGNSHPIGNGLRLWIISSSELPSPLLEDPQEDFLPCLTLITLTCFLGSSFK